MSRTIPTSPKIVIFGSPNLLIERYNETIWRTMFGAIGETASYERLRKDFKTGQLTPLQWAQLSSEQFTKAGMTKEVYEGALSFNGLKHYAKEVIDGIRAWGGIPVILSGGFSDLCLEAAHLAGIEQLVSQATPIFDEDGRLRKVFALNCDYSGKRNFAEAVAHSMGYGLEDCILIAEGEGDIALARSIPSIAFNAPTIVERACDTAVRGDIGELLYIVKVDSATTERSLSERKVPHTVLIGNPESNSVLVDFDCRPEKHSNLLDYFALIGPLMTDRPGVGILMDSIRETGVNCIYVTGNPSVFKPHIALEEAVKKHKGLKLIAYDGKIEVEKRNRAIQFVHGSLEARKVYRSPFVPDNISFVVYEFSGVSMIDVYRDREKIDSLTGDNSALLENIVARYGDRVLAGNIRWVGEQLLGGNKHYEGIIEFETLQEAYAPVVVRTWTSGRKYADERGEETTEISPLAIRIKDVEKSTIPSNENLGEIQIQKYVRQFLGEENAAEFDYSIWQRMETQINDVLEMLAKNPETRRAHLLIGREDDVRKAMTGFEQPCHFAFDFMIKDVKLDMYAYLRSNDVVRAFPADVYAAMQLQARLAKELNVGVGTYTHIATRAQIYSRDYMFVESLIGK